VGTSRRGEGIRKEEGGMRVNMVDVFCPYMKIEE
jgi:hypothetical protein